MAVHPTAQRKDIAMTQHDRIARSAHMIAALLLAAGLAADGQTRVAPLETVERGYSHLVERLKGLGAKIAKVE